MADDARATADKQLIHAARTDNVDLFNSVVNADPPVPYDINYADGVGNTALHYAVENVSIHVLDLILDEEVDVDARNRLEGDTPLHLACRISNEEARNYVGLRPVDTIVGARAESELGKQCIEMLTMSQAEAQLEPTDIAYDDDDIADDGESDVEP